MSVLTESRGFVSLIYSPLPFFCIGKKKKKKIQTFSGFNQFFKLFADVTIKHFHFLEEKQVCKDLGKEIKGLLLGLNLYF